MKNIILLLIIFLITACNTGNETAEITVADVAGTYSGVVPCADCEGIRYALTLNEDATFSDEMLYIGKSGKALTATGKFSIENGMIVLNKPTIGYSHFRKHPEGLLMLDKDGKEAEGAIAPLYVLRKTDGASGEDSRESTAALAVPDSVIKPRQDNTEYDEAKAAKINRHISNFAKGVNFHASGTEPFWNLGINFQEGMIFTTLDSLNIQTPMGEATEREDGTFRKFSAVTELGELIVTLEDKECADQMIGEQFDYSVTVTTKYATEKDYRTYKGCGEYVIDPRLHNIWVIEEFEGEPIDATKFKRGIPQIEINVKDGIYLGHDGCNGIRGNLNVELNEIKFEPGPATLMACDDDGKSSRISLALSETAYDYVLSNRLELVVNGDVRFKLRNID